MKRDQLAVAPESLDLVSITFLEGSVLSAFAKELDAVGFTKAYHAALLDMMRYVEHPQVDLTDAVMAKVCNVLTTPSPPLATEASVAHPFLAMPNFPRRCTHRPPTTHPKRGATEAFHKQCQR